MMPSSAGVWSVSIHSWSSYQEKLKVWIMWITVNEFQSTPGLVTRRNGFEFSYQGLLHSFNPLLV